MLTADQKTIIEQLADIYTDFGPYKLAGMIANRTFEYAPDNDWVSDISATASYYSILNVIRRFRSRVAA